MTTGIEVRSLQAGYDDNIVIDELNLTIPKDSITALIGANGCGKSTLLKTICRILQPMGGSVYLDGRSIHERNTADFIVAMREGSIVKTGMPEEVMTPTILRRVFGITATVMTDPYTGRPFCIPQEAGVAAAEVSVPETVKASSSVAVTA